MSEISNYIPVSRKIFEHLFWCEDRVYSRFEAWLDIIQCTRFEDTELLIGNRLITVKRGQLPVSLRYLAERWKWSTKKVSGFLDLLILAQMITKETLKETGQTLITVCNYDIYNFNPKKRKRQKKREGNTKETLRKQEGNKYNKDNKENKENIPPSIPPPGKEEEEKFDFNSLKPPEDGVDRNFPALMEFFRKYPFSETEKKEIILASNYGQIGSAVWPLISEVRNNQGIKLPVQFILKRLGL